METFELSTVINRPIEEVFTVLSNLENDLKWRTEWVDAKKFQKARLEWVPSLVWLPRLLDGGSRRYTRQSNTSQTGSRRGKPYQGPSR